MSFADGRAESVLESLSRVSISRAGLPMPELQVRFILPDGSEARVDMYWERWRLVGECDGLGKYGAAEGEVAVRRRLRAEKARQNGLEALGNTVRSWLWQDWERDRIPGIVRSAMLSREKPGRGGRRAS